MMKKKYYLLFLCATSLVIANVKQEVGDIFNDTRLTKDTPYISDSKEEVFAENNNSVEVNDPFELKDISDSIYEKASPSVVSTPKVKREKPLKVIGTRTQDSMLIINGDDVKVNPKIFNDALCRDCLQMTEYLYLATKRYDKDHRVYPGAFLKKTDLPKPPTYNTLTNRGIEIFAPIMGVNGGIEEAIIGMLAYRLQQGHLEVFIVLEGSQGEPFEFLGGIGGASWRTNFLSDKKIIEAQELNLDKKYGKLSFHEGYLGKICTMDLFTKPIPALFKHLNIKDVSEYNATADNVTQQDIDNWRGFTIDVYVFGHSQAGGLTLVGMPYITVTIGRLLYGDSFDNKTFNIAHAICESPARAVGDEHTLKVIFDVAGIKNIFGFCSPIDVIPCLPLGHNIDKRPIAKIRATVGLTILKAISLFLPKKWSDFISAISSTKFNYEELPIFAYVDYGDVLGRYCDVGIKVYRDYLGIMKEKGAKVDEKQFQKKIDSWTKIKEQIPEIRKLVTSMQENYFKAHTSNIITSKYYALKAVHYLRKLLQKVPIEDLIGSQHWGAPVLLQNKDSKRQVWYETLYNASLPDSNIQKAIDRGKKYGQWKGEFVPESKSKNASRFESIDTDALKIEPMVTN
ncbi:MAG: hypothetical protein ACSW8C_01865 [bacterium]